MPCGDNRSEKGTNKYFPGFSLNLVYPWEFTSGLMALYLMIEGYFLSHAPIGYSVGKPY